MAWLVRTFPELSRRARQVRDELTVRLLRDGLHARAVSLRRLPVVLAWATRARLLPVQLEGLIAANLERHGSAEVRAAVGAALDRLAGKRHRAGRGKLLTAALRVVARDSLPAALELGEALIERADHPAARRALASVHEQVGAIRRPLELLTSIEGDNVSAVRARLQRHARLLGESIALSPRGARAHPAHPRRILYYASQSLPHHPSGYAIRTHWLVRHLRDRGWDVSVHTRHGYPNDRHDFSKLPIAAAAAEVDGVSYAFVPDRERGIRALDIEAYQAACVETLVRQAQAVRPAVIHCASNFPVGLAGTEAARRLGIPSIYEVRGLWHMTRASKQPEYAASDHHELSERLEAEAARNADHVFAITAALRDILVERGVPADKITVLPNAVDIDAFGAREPDPALVARWQLGGRTVLGYIGGFKHYEGIDLLIDAAARLRATVGDRFRVLLVGDGPVRGQLEAQVARLGLGGLVTFTGAQPHASIAAYYALVDVLTFPRRGYPVCEVVSPLKPFEAMAMAKPIVVSDVRALTEIVEHGVTGLVHRRDDADSLAEALAECIARPDLRLELGQRAAAWTREHRSWPRIAAEVDAVYQRLIDA